MSCDVGKAREGLENELCYDYNYELCSFSNLSVTSPTSQLILIRQAFRHFTYVTAYSPTLPLLYLRHNSSSNPSVASPTSQLILRPLFRLSYVTEFSLTSPGEPPMLYLRHSSFSNPSIASPMSQLILQPFFRFSYVTGYSLMSPMFTARRYLNHSVELLTNSRY